MCHRLAFAVSLLSLLLALPACSPRPVSTASAGTPSPTATAPATATATETATAMPSGPPGSISGDELMYPADSMPSLAIYAIDTTDSQRYFFVVTRAGNLGYSIPRVAPGTYYVIAYLANPPSGNFKALAGGYTREVPCALSGAVDCNDHTLIPVTVHASETVKHINPNDYYGGTYPPRPGT